MITFEIAPHNLAAIICVTTGIMIALMLIIYEKGKESND